MAHMNRKQMSKVHNGTKIGVFGGKFSISACEATIARV
jgi:hypothetical protein